jgi:hypothetical protein
VGKIQSIAQKISPYFRLCGSDGELHDARRDLFDNIGDCPQTDSGDRLVNRWILKAAHSLKRSSISYQLAATVIANLVLDCGRKVRTSEINRAVEKVYCRKNEGESPPILVGGKSTAKAAYDPAVLARIADDIEGDIDRHFLFELSPVRPDCVSPGWFLSNVFHAREKVAVLRTFHERRPACIWQQAAGDQGVPSLSYLQNDSPDVYFLANPIDGRRHTLDGTGQWSMRCAAATTDFRHAVLESDKAPPSLWLALLVQLPIPIVAIYTSGRRSIHALWKIGARTKEEFDEIVGPLKPRLTTLGADPAALTAVRLTRLPNCWRRSSGGFQKLLYLNPDPDATPLIEREFVRDRAELYQDLADSRAAEVENV